jgi:DNA helicase-2/ATP-dependent DNA helicase PcrA
LEELPATLIDWRRTGADVTSWAGHVASSFGERRAAPMRSAAAARKSQAKRPAIALSPGDRVVHDTFGMGTVVAMQGAGDKAVASIDFGSEGVKRLLMRYAPVEKL